MRDVAIARKKQATRIATRLPVEGGVFPCLPIGHTLLEPAPAGRDEAGGLGNRRPLCLCPLRPFYEGLDASIGIGL
jgi:hypothetical protein